MKTYTKLAVVACVLLMFSMASFAQKSRAASQKSEASTTPPTIASVLNQSLSSVEHEVLNAAEAIPEDKYDFSPATGNIPGDFKTPEPARDMGAQFKHIADALEFYSSRVLGQKRPTGGENGPANVKTKAEIISYLKAEFAKAHSAIDTINQQNAVEELSGRGHTTRLAQAVQMVSHTALTYGNIIEYMRMNGIVPPESRRSS